MYMSTHLSKFIYICPLLSTYIQESRSLFSSPTQSSFLLITFSYLRSSQEPVSSKSDLR
ncbi:hypothetical protein HanRHA438_Chr06g0260091 [Helianthus annuus]|nr:hypothetical protein HanIR_Chr06g0269911 [Helianthus annuus]KAJ0911150.1 hypothetical protein HanRHA438_Chr06g0260091 [Helianthus annuus]